MKKLNFLLLFVLPFLFSSCDPAHNINFINNGKNNIKVKLVIDPKTEDQTLIRYKKGDSIIFNLKPNLIETNQGELFFGMGTWHEDEIKELSKSIKSIEIENIDYKKVYQSKYAIEKLLLQNRKGFWWKTDIDININDDILN